jgi:hypothetical protein
MKYSEVVDGERRWTREAWGKFHTTGGLSRIRFMIEALEEAGFEEKRDLTLKREFHLGGLRVEFDLARELLEVSVADGGSGMTLPLDEGLTLWAILRGVWREARI